MFGNFFFFAYLFLLLLLSTESNTIINNLSWNNNKQKISDCQPANQPAVKKNGFYCWLIYRPDCLPYTIFLLLFFILWSLSVTISPQFRFVSADMLTHIMAYKKKSKKKFKIFITGCPDTFNAKKKTKTEKSQNLPLVIKYFGCFQCLCNGYLCCCFVFIHCFVFWKLKPYQHQ